MGEIDWESCHRNKQLNLTIQWNKKAEEDYGIELRILHCEYEWDCSKEKMIDMKEDRNSGQNGK